MTNRPNLFEFATSELSQDAFICWLISWANPVYKETDTFLHKTAIFFIEALFSKHKITPPHITCVKIHRQKNNIDIGVIINETYFIVIEDKVHAPKHGNQLARYFTLAHEKYPKCQILPIFLKTSYQAHYNNENYELFLLDDFIKVLEFGFNLGIDNAIFIDFFNTLTKRKNNINSYKNLTISEWGLGWIGFFKELQANITVNWLDWGYIQNQQGGFWGLWACQVKPNEPNTNIIHFLLREVKDSNDIKIQFLIEPHKQINVDKKQLKYAWAEKFKLAGTKLGLKIEKVNRFGDGGNMAVAHLVEQVIFYDDNHNLDIAKSIAIIKKCIEVVHTAAL